MKMRRKMIKYKLEEAEKQPVVFLLKSKNSKDIKDFFYSNFIPYDEVNFSSKNTDIDYTEIVCEVNNYEIIEILKIFRNKKTEVLIINEK
jgi:hypothetical protein